MKEIKSKEEFRCCVRQLGESQSTTLTPIPAFTKLSVNEQIKELQDMLRKVQYMRNLLKKA